MLKNIIKTAIVLVALCVAWEWLEFLIYGAVQPRTVDDIMLLLFAPIVYVAVSKKNQKKENNYE